MVVVSVKCIQYWLYAVSLTPYSSTVPFDTLTMETPFPCVNHAVPMR